MNENAIGLSLIMSPTIQKLATALIATQAALPTVPKDKENPFFHSKYAGLETVMPLALAVLTEHGLGLVQSVGHDANGATTLTTILMHESGEWIGDTQPLLLAKADPQGQGSAITYARRYAVMAMLGLVAEADDDGNAASRPRPATARPKAQAAPLPRNGSPPTPADRPAYDEKTKITDTQIKAIRGALKRMFGDDERAAFEWMQGAQPRATESGTMIHLGELTMAEASTILFAVNEWTAKQKAAQP